MQKAPKILHFDCCEWQVMREKVMMKCFQGESVTIQYAKLSPGQVAMILQGECDFFVEGVAYPMSAGSIMSIPPMAEHYVLVKGPQDVINLDIFYPKRPDREESIENIKVDQ